MGLIHDTKSNIFGIETRGESAFLSDIDDINQHLFIRYVRKSDVREEIAEAIMKQAGEYFGKGKFKEAELYKQIADIVKQTALSPDVKPRSLEASYEWIKDLLKFFAEKDILPKTES